MAILSFILVGLSILIAVPVIVFCIEIIAALTSSQKTSPSFSAIDNRPSLAVLIPAHNEGAGLVKTLENIKPQLLPNDCLLVVADNCDDDTAQIASAAGAMVTERHNPIQIGKGYALDWGIRYLSAAPPDIVIIIDADCRLGDGSIDHLVKVSWASQRAVQALDLMIAPDGSSINYRVAEFAWRVKNWLRPLGLAAVGLPCQLMGTGMAFPWSIIQSAQLASGSLVEDMKLGLDLARSGRPPLFCPSAVVTSEFPTSAKGADSQRKRWEQGHIGMIITRVPGLLLQSLVKCNLGMLALTLDVAVPPLTLLGMLVFFMLVASGFGYLVGLSPVATLISFASFIAFSASLILCWIKVGRDVLPATAIWSLASYAARKGSLYRQLFSNKRGEQWVRTDRDKPSDDQRKP